MSKKNGTRVQVNRTRTLQKYDGWNKKLFYRGVKYQHEFDNE